METRLSEKWYTILNPNAGSRLGEKDWPSIEQEFNNQGITFELATTRCRLDAVQITIQAIEQGYRKFIVIGGDGTLNEVVNGIMQQTFVEPAQILLGMVSVGTGNDWIKTHGISSDYKIAISQIKEGKTILQDVGKIVFQNGHPAPETRFFVNSVGIGFDARVIKYIQPRREKGKSGKGIYMKGLLNSLLNHRNIPALLSFDGEQFDAALFNLTVGICRYKGGGFKMLPFAIPDDGKLDVTLARKISKLKLIKSLPKILGGQVEKIKYFDFYTVSELSVLTDHPVCVEADGEFLGFKPLQVSIVPNQLRLISEYRNY